MRAGMGAESSAGSNQETHLGVRSIFSGWALVWMALTAIALLRWMALNWHPVGLHVDEAQYWLWSRDLDWGYFSKPPGIAALISASTSLFGDNTNGIRMLAMACWLVCAAVLVKLGGLMHSRRAGLWAGALFATTPAANLLGLVATTDAPLLLGWTATMALTWWACNGAVLAKRNWLPWALVGLAWGATMNAKYTAAALAPSLLWAVWVTSRPLPAVQQRLLWLGLLGALAVAGGCLVPNLAWNAQHEWPTVQHTLDITWRAKDVIKDGPMASPLLRWVYLVGGLGLLCGPALLVALSAQVIAISRPAKLASNHLAQRWAAGFVLPLCLVGTTQALLGGVQVNWLAPVLPGICLIAGFGLSSGTLPRWVTGAAVVGMITSATLSLWVAANTDLRWWVDAHQATGKPLDFWHKTRHWPPALKALEPHVALHQWPIWTAERDVLVQAAHAWRDLSPDLRAWSPTGRVRHHFDMFYPAQPGLGPVLWLHRTPPPPELIRKQLVAKQLVVSEHGPLRLELWQLEPLNIATP